MLNIVNINKKFNVSYLPNLKLWISADKINTELGSPVNFCPDLSDNNNNCTNFSSVAPILGLSAHNMQPTIIFSGVSGQELTSSQTINTIFKKFTFCCVARINTSSGTQSLLGSNFTGVEIGGNLSNFYVYSQGASNLFSWAMPRLIKQAYIFTLTYDVINGPYKAYLNGNLVASGTNANSFTAYPLKIGASGVNNSLSPFNGEISEVMFFDNILSRIETEKIEQYLNRKYNAFLITLVPPFTPITNIYNSSNGNETVPTGTTQCIIEVWGGGGGGGISDITTGRTGGGGGAYSKSILSISIYDYGQNILWAVGPGGASHSASASNTPGFSGQSSSVNASILISPCMMNAQGGVGNGVGGTASGGTTTNISGGTTVSGSGAASPNGGGGGNTIGASGGAPGGGGAVGDGTHNSGAGANGRVSFAWS